MAAKFGATSTTDDVLAGLDLKGNRVLVTGTSSGLGIETSRALVAHGAYVVGAARDLDKAYTATGAVRTAAATRGGFELIEADLGSLASAGPGPERRPKGALWRRVLPRRARQRKSGTLHRPPVRAAR